MASPPQPSPGHATAALGIAPLGFLYLGFAALCLALLRPALDGPPVSDDFVYIIYNPYLSPLSLENVLAILDPWGAPASNTVNYAPVHLLLHALEAWLFGPNLFANHVVNVLVHALGSVLLVVLLLRSRIPLAFALLGGALFAVHPANVEAVAWLFQLKTSVALALALGGLLALERRPVLATTLFGLALLTKASSAFALPMAAAFVWARQGSWAHPESRGSWRGMAAWAVLLGLYAIPEFSAFEYAVAVDVEAYNEPGVQIRTIAAIGVRYLVMAATSFGVSAFHEPAFARSWLDPWFLASLPCGGVLTWRAVTCLAQRREEGAFWLGAAAAFVPISQVFPFLYPMGDRYLYFMLPGLIGGALLAGADLNRKYAWRLAGGDGGAGSATAGRIALLAGGALAVYFAAHSAQRAPLWRAETRLFADAAKNYPDGGNAHFLRALEAMQMGDKHRAITSLRDAIDRGYDKVRDLSRDSLLEPIRDDAEFKQLMREIAGRRIALGRKRGYHSQIWLHYMADAHRQRDEYREAAALLERALDTEGPLSAKQLNRELMEVRRAAGSVPDGK